MKKCLIEGCESPSAKVRTKGLCNSHYMRLRKYGDPTHVPPPRRGTPLITRILNKISIAQETQCWEWQGHRNERGYGLADETGGRTVQVHRHAYQHLVGPIPDGMFVLHRCDNPPCVNPKHLFLGTHLMNMADMRAKGRSRSPKRPRGSSAPLAKLNEAQVADIKLALRNCNSTSDLAKSYGVVRSSILRIKNGETWAHVHIEGVTNDI